MKKSISLFLVIGALWLMLSGHFEPLLLGLGLASVSITVFLSLRMNVVDHESHPVHLTLRMLRFFVFLWREIILANIDVVKRIIKPGQSISPRMVNLPLPQKTVLGRVMYANAITLTPGTVSVQLDQQTIQVHALSREGAEDLATGRIASAVPEDSEEPAS